MLHGRRHLQLVDSERDAMRLACRFNAQLMDYIRPHVQPGVRTEEIDRLVHDYTLDHGHVPACLGYHGFPKSCCTSVNEVICHGIPGSYELKPGDIVNIDITSIVEGWYGDQSETFFIGEVSDEAKQVTQCAFDSMHRAIEAIYPECRVSEIGKVIVEEAKKFGYGVVEEFVGHGLGRRFHQEPSIPHVPTRAAHSIRILPGVCFTIEPMINIGGPQTSLDQADGWTVRTQDRSLSAQFEHTVLMTENGAEILTLTKDGPQKGHRFL